MADHADDNPETRNANDAARCELEQQLLGWQIGGVPGAIEFASTELRTVAQSFVVPHSRIQLAILKIADQGHSLTVTNIAAELGEYPAFHQTGGIEYLRNMADAAPTVITPEGARKLMSQALFTWRQRQQPQPKIGSVALVRGDLVEPKPVHWIWDGWMAQRKLHILAGQPGTGKTSIAVAMAATISSGGNFPDGKSACPGSALIWSGEDDFEDTLLPRFMACGGVRSRFHSVGGIYDENCAVQPFDPAIDMAALVAAASGLPDLRLIIIDPVVSVVAGDSHRNAEVRRALQPLAQLAEQTGAAVIGLTHLTKGTVGRDPLERITGSVAFGAVARLVWFTAKSNDADQPSRIVRAKSNIGPAGDGFEYDLHQVVFDPANGHKAQTIQWGKPLQGSAKDLIAELEGPETGTRVSALEAAMAWLTEMLGTGTVRVTFLQEMAEAKGHAWPTVERAKKALGAVSVKQGAEGWCWRMSKVINPDEDAP